MTAQKVGDPPEPEPEDQVEVQPETARLAEPDRTQRVDPFTEQLEASFRLKPEILEARRRKIERMSPEEREKFHAREDRQPRRIEWVDEHFAWLAAGVLALVVLAVFLVQLLEEPRNRLIALIVVVVLLGAFGLILRGMGELARRVQTSK